MADQFDAFKYLNNRIHEEEEETVFDPKSYLDSSIQQESRKQVTDVNQDKDLLDTLSDYAYNGFSYLRNSLKESSRIAEQQAQSGMQVVRPGITVDPEQARKTTELVLDTAPFVARVGAGIGTGLSGAGLLGSAFAAESAGLATEAITSSIKEYLELSPDEDETLPDFIQTVSQQGLGSQQAVEMVDAKMRETGKNIAYDLAFGGAFSLAGRVASQAVNKAQMVSEVRQQQKLASKQGLFEKVDKIVDSQIKPKTEASALADELGVPQTISTAGPGFESTAHTLSRVPFGRGPMKRGSEAAVKAFDDLINKEISLVGKPLSPSQITDELSVYFKDTEMGEIAKTLPQKKNVLKGYEVGKKLSEAAQSFSKQRQKELSSLYTEARKVVPKNIGIVPSNTLSKIDQFLESIPSVGRTGPVDGMQGFKASDILDKNLVKLKEEILISQSTGKPINIDQWNKFRSHLNEIAYRGAEDTNVKQLKAVASEMLNDEVAFVKKLTDQGAMTDEARKKLVTARQYARDTAEKNELISNISFSPSGQKAFDVARGFDPEQLSRFKGVLDEIDPKAFGEFRDNQFYKLAVNSENPSEHGIEHFVKNYSKMKESGFDKVLFEGSPGLQKEYDRLLKNFNKMNTGKALDDPARSSGLNKLSKLSKAKLNEFQSILKETDPELYDSTLASLLKDMGTNSEGVFSGQTFAKNFDKLDYDGLVGELYKDATVDKLRKISKLVKANETTYNIALDKFTDSYGQIIGGIRAAHILGSGLMGGNNFKLSAATEIVLNGGPMIMSRLYTNPTYVRWVNSVLETPNPSKKQLNMMVGRLIGMASADEDLRYALRDYFAQDSLIQNHYENRIQEFRRQQDRSAAVQNLLLRSPSKAP